MTPPAPPALLPDTRFVPAHTLRRPMSSPPTLLVIHYTATPAGTGPQVARAFQAPAAKASAHLVIDTNGAVIQCVEFDRQAAHAGVSSYRGRAGCNGYSIGIELVNPGPLQPDGNGGFTDTYHRPFVGQAVEAPSGRYRYWAPYPAAQMEALVSATRYIVGHYPIAAVTGHSHIAPGRKIDPGLAFDWSSYLELSGLPDTFGP